MLKNVRSFLREDEQREMAHPTADRKACSPISYVKCSHRNLRIADLTNHACAECTRN